MTKSIDWRALGPIPWAPPGIPGLVVIEDDSEEAWLEWDRLRAANPTAKFGLIASSPAPRLSPTRYEPIGL